MYATIAFCDRCKSQKVDVFGWRGSVAQVRCVNYGQEGSMDGFSLGRTDVQPAKIMDASHDIAQNRLAAK